MRNQHTAWPRRLAGIAAASALLAAAVPARAGETESYFTGDECDFIDTGFDGVPLSHHVLTTDGILGRDTLGGASPMRSLVSWPPRADTGRRRAMAAPRAATGPEAVFASEEDLP